MGVKKNRKSKARRWLKAGAWIAGISILLFVGLVFFTGWLQRKIEKMAHQESAGVYRLQLHGLQVSPFVGGLSVDSLALTPDYEQWKQVHRQTKEAPRMLLRLRVGQLDISGLSYFRALFKNNVSVGLLRIREPELLFTQMREDTTQQQHEPLHQSLQGMLQGLKVDSLQVTDAVFRYRSSADAGTDNFTVRRFDLTVKDFQLDSSSFHAEDRAYYAREIAFAADSAIYLLPGGLYRTRTGSVKLNTGDGTLSVENIRLIPQAKPAEMARQKGEAVTYLEAALPAVRLAGVQYGTHSRNNTFIARKAELEGLQVSAFKDKQNFRNKGIKPLPHDMVQQIQASFLLDTVQIRNMYVRYDELAAEATETGYIFFDQLNATITNLSNMPEHISGEKPAVVRASANAMGKAPLDVTIHLPLLESNGFHTIEVKAGAANPEILNPILAPTTFMSIKSGKLNSGRASVVLNREQASGTMQVLYQNFKIDLLSKDEDKEQSLGKKVLSKVVNWAAIKSDNPDTEGEKPRVGEISASRDKGRSVFTYWKDCLASGFLSSAGLDIIAEK